MSATLRQGVSTFRLLGEMSVPTFAFVNGTAIGGGLELALHCTYRVAREELSTIALPEGALGLVPGWGGTYLLPRLIGPAAAIEVIVQHPLDRRRMLTSASAHRLGVVDTCLPGDGFRASALVWAAEVIRGSRTVARQAPSSDEAYREAVERGRRMVDARTPAGLPAPRRALELIAAAGTVGRDEGFAAAVAAATDLLCSEEFRASLYAFQLVRPVPGAVEGISAPRAVGVLGTGEVAIQLAQVLSARATVPVVLVGSDPADTEVAVRRVRAALAADPATVGPVERNISGDHRFDALAGCDLVVEAAPEDLAEKQRLLAAAEAVAPVTAVLATTTAAFPVGEVASALRRPEQLVGLHFTTPATLLPLVEVVSHDGTATGTRERAGELVRIAGKTGVPVRDTPGLVVRRIQARLLNEAMRAIDAGFPRTAVDRALAPLGLPVPPLSLLMVLTPRAVLAMVSRLHSAYPERFPTPARSLREAADGQRPTSTPPNTPEPSEEILGTVRRRILVALAEEVQAMVDEGVVRSVADVDRSLILGAAFPMHLGGITPYLDRTGIAQLATGARFLPPGTADMPPG